MLKQANSYEMRGYLPAFSGESISQSNSDQKQQILPLSSNNFSLQHIRDEEEEEELGIGMQNVKVLNSDPNSKFQIPVSLFLNQFAISLYVGFRGLLFNFCAYEIGSYFSLDSSWWYAKPLAIPTK